MSLRALLFVHTKRAQEVMAHQNQIHRPRLRDEFTPVVCDGHLHAASRLMRCDQPSLHHPAR